MHIPDTCALRRKRPKLSPLAQRLETWMQTTGWSTEGLARQTRAQSWVPLRSLLNGERSDLPRDLLIAVAEFMNVTVNDLQEVAGSDGRIEPGAPHHFTSG